MMELVNKGGRVDTWRIKDSPVQVDSTNPSCKGGTAGLHLYTKQNR